MSRLSTLKSSQVHICVTNFHRDITEPLGCCSPECEGGRVNISDTPGRTEPRIRSYGINISHCVR